MAGRAKLIAILQGLALQITSINQNSEESVLLIVLLQLNLSLESSHT